MRTFLRNPYPDSAHLTHPSETDLANGSTRCSGRRPPKAFEFSTHIIPPESILYLTGELYDKSPDTWMMAISGREWGLGKELSDPARANLERAIDYARNTIFGTT